MKLRYQLLFLFLIPCAIAQQCVPHYDQFNVFLGMSPACMEDIPAPVNDIPSQHKPLVSFEEWQKRALQNDKRHKRKSSSSDEKAKQVVDSIDGGFSDDFGSMLEGFIGGLDKKTPNVYTEGEYISPTHSSAKKDVRIKSLKERFNYASIDCAATVRKANKQAKGAQSILYESKDQYLLNKCAADKFVIINLCEQIVVDTIVMANFEFFSSTFKDFKVYASSKYPTEDWRLLGQWQARNTRDLQVFRVPDSGYVDYLKIEFLTHYGREYYCPLSLVRVHGMTMMEIYTTFESQDQDPEVEHLWPAEVREQIIQPQFDVANTSESFPIKIETEEEDTEPTISPIDPPDTEIKLDLELAELSQNETIAADTVIETEDSATTSVITAATPMEPVISETPSDTSQSAVSVSSEEPESSTESAAPSTVSNITTASVESFTTAIPLSTTSLSQSKVHQKEGSSQESIYKTIMKRLNVLEHDMTLSQRFLDDQNKILNDVFLDMEKKHQEQLILLIGHLNETASQKIDNMKRRYEQWYDDLKEQNENDIREMTAKISILADQLSFERRVSVSQLVIMIALFVFMALSRGTFSTLSPVMAAQQEERKRRESMDQQVPTLDTSKKTVNPRRHSDSPYHVMGEMELHVPTRSRKASNATQSKNSRNLSRHASNDSIKASLQSEILQKKLDDLLIEQEQQ